MISLIVAIDKNNLIGKNNELPWYYPEDLKYFKKMTLHKTVLMGQATFESIISRIGKPLPNRQTIVATLDPNFQYPGVKIIHDLVSFLNEEHEEEIVITGGKQIYTISLPYVKRLYITHINKEYEGNVFFPEIDYKKYNLLSETKLDELAFCVYERIK